MEILFTKEKDIITNKGPHIVTSTQTFSKSITISEIYTPKVTSLPLDIPLLKAEDTINRYQKGITAKEKSSENP